MGAPKGNKNAKGNKGGGRKSAYQEMADAKLLNDIFFDAVDIKKLRKSLEKGKYSVKEAFILKALEGSTRHQIAIFKKIFPEKFKDETPPEDRVVGIQYVVPKEPLKKKVS